MNSGARLKGLGEGAGRVVAFLGAYYLLGLLSYRAAFSPTGTLAVWWAPSGLALAILVRAERRQWPWLVGAIFVAATAVNAAQPIRFIELPFRSFADCVEPMAGAWLLRRRYGPDVNLRGLGEVAWFALAGCVVGPAVGTLAAGVSALIFEPSLVSVGEFALLWWGSAALGVSLFAPLILAWRAPSHWPGRRRIEESVLLTSLLVAVSVGSFFVPARSPLVLLIGFATFPLLSWSAVRFGPAGGARAAVTLSIFSLWPFLGAWREPHPWQIIVIQGIYGVGALTSLTLSALVSEMRQLRIQADLQKKKAEESLVLLESALQEAPFGMAFFDAQGRFTRMNGVFAALSGKPGERLAGEGLEVAFPDMAERMLPRLRAALRGETGDTEIETSRRGSLRTWTCFAFPVAPRGGSPTGAGLLLIEDTERRAAEEDSIRLFRKAQEAVQVREDFLSVASHELKTPLTPIFARLGSLQRKLRAGEPLAADSLDKPLESLRKLTELINDLLDASRIAYGRLTLHRAPHVLGELVRKSAEPFRGASPLHPLSISIPEQPLWAMVDPQRLDQVITNLLDNAIKYTPSGGPVEVLLRPHPEGAELTVTDHGVGILPEQREHLFERFYRTALATRSTGGLGLGLYISRDIVERHGGRIWAESEPGRGSRFHVVLPCLSPADLQVPIH